MVLVTPITSQNLLKTHILLKQNEIEIIPSGSSPIVTVNSKKIELPVGKEVKITGILGTNTNAIIATLLRTTDSVVVIKAPRFLLEEVATNGKHRTYGLESQLFLITICSIRNLNILEVIAKTSFPKMIEPS